MLNVMLGSLQKNARMLRELSYIDPLTLLWNRRRFREVLSDELRRVQEKAGKGFGLAFIDVDASRTSTVRSATPPGIWFCGSSQSSRGRSSSTQRRSHGLGEMSSCCSCPMPMRVPCSASLRRSGKPARNGCLSMPIGMCVSASASGAIGLRCRHYRHV